MLRRQVCKSVVGHRPRSSPVLLPKSLVHPRPSSSKTTKGGTILTFRPFSSSNVFIPGVRNEYGSLGEMSVPSSHSRMTPWQAEDNRDIQMVTQKALIYELTQQQTRTIETVVPWFLDNMPSSYFRQIPEPFRMDHIKAIAAVKDANMDLYLNLKTHLPDGREVLTFVRPGTKPGTLLHMISDLPYKDVDSGPDYQPLTRLHVFSTEDESMSLNMFVYGLREGGPGFDLEESAEPILDYAAQIQAGTLGSEEAARAPNPSPLFERENLLSYLEKCSLNYITFGITDPRRFLLQREIFNSVSGTEGSAVHIEPDTREPNHYWVDVAVANSRPLYALEHLCRLLFLHDFDVARARLDVVRDGDNGDITMLRMLVSPISGTQVSTETFDLLSRELKRSKWLDDVTMNLVFDRYPWLGVTRGEIITALCALMHPQMAKENSIIYSKANIFNTLTSERFIRHTAAIANLFLERFDPRAPLSDEELEIRCKAFDETIEHDVEDTVALNLLQKMIEIVKHTLKTNVYLPDRYSLGLRLDPKLMESQAGDEHEIPYGVFFVHGRRYNGYHVRFRDIARGGLRLVTPPSPEQYALESARQYDECYGLAYAQQLKNKDIPEGGAKAVVLVDTYGHSEATRDLILRKSVKGFTDSLLDLIVDTDETKDNIVDFYGKPEILYLGPDEQVIPDDINWVVNRAAARGHPKPAAFMSSKPKAGINHKEYGVTSEGINVYLDVALRRVLGIDPTKQSFTVKLTGGPDGDVAGNEIKILIREYGDNVKIVGLADASGCAEDPEGLDHDELLRLVKEGLTVSNFRPSKLKSTGILSTCETSEGTKARNSMHNRVKADAFVPCGGRPNTIDGTNYKQFLQPNGEASSPLIVEGANLFITAEARQKLFDTAGVVIVKDSSANKGGVITSSYEIISAMLLSEEEFFENKAEIVAEVLDKLRALAEREANLLITEYENYGGSLPEASQIISNCINITTDALAEALDTLSEQDREALLPLFRAHLPKTIVDLAFDEIQDRVPDQYIKNAISSCLASKVVYKEGTSFISSVPKQELANMALKYVEKEREVAALIETLEKADISAAEKDQIIKLLEAGGARTALTASQH